MTAQVINSFRGEYSFLSNFFQAPFRTPKGNLCVSVEHAFQACKTLDTEQQQWVLHSPTATEAKKRGRKVALRADWNDIRVRVMESLVLMKFEQNPRLRDRLLATGDAVLVEGNTWHDTFWGVCNGKGENHLGQILMKVRAILANQPA